MDVILLHADDRQRLEHLIRSERDAKQRDRFRAALLATQGEQAPQIVAKLGRSRRFVQAWAYAYRDGGVDVPIVFPLPWGPDRMAVVDATLRAAASS